MSEDHIGAAINGVLYVKFEDAKKLREGWDKADAEIEKLRAENERLKAGGCARDQNTTQFCAEAVALKAEIEKLRAALHLAIDAVEHWASYASPYFQEKHDLAGDLQELRAALGEKE